MNKLISFLAAPLSSLTLKAREGNGGQPITLHRAGRHLFGEWSPEKHNHVEGILSGIAIGTAIGVGLCTATSDIHPILAWPAVGICAGVMCVGWVAAWTNTAICERFRDEAQAAYAALRDQSDADYQSLQEEAGAMIQRRNRKIRNLQKTCQSWEASAVSGISFENWNGSGGCPAGAEVAGGMRRNGPPATEGVVVELSDWRRS